MTGRAFAVAIALLVLFACQRPYAAWLESSDGQGRFTLGVGTSRGDRDGIDVEIVAIASCTDHDAAIQGPGQLSGTRLATLPWAIVRTMDIDDLKTIDYGVVPLGYRQVSAGAAPLDPGCYVAEVAGVHGGQADVRLTIDSAGRASEIR